MILARDTQAGSSGAGAGASGDRRIHPLVRLDYTVRLIACPLLASVALASRIGAGESISPLLWALFGVYALFWPHGAFLLARRSTDFRAFEMRCLLVDCAAAGVGIALGEFQFVPSLGVATAIASLLTSVGGLPLLFGGMSVLVAGSLITGATVTDFAVSQSASMLGTVLASAGLIAFQTMMGLLTYRTARNFISSRRRIAEQAEEIRIRNEELVQAREEALQAAQAKAAFLATMSHEIRTPLNGVLGMTRLLADTPLTADQQDFVRTIQVSGTTLLTVINDILDYSRIESGRLELEEEPIRVREVVEDALEIVAERARQRGIELVCELDPGVPSTIAGDATRLRQVLTNLAGNAVKFTEAGEVVVSVRASAGEGDLPVQVEFSVRDTGIGIPEDRLPLLFTPFTQADASTTRRYGGTGLGLAISKRLTELMGGSVSVRSTPGAGSTFTFSIRAAVAAEEARAIEPAAVQGLRVLVVDDNETNRTVLGRQLESWGLHAEVAGSAAEALRVLETGSEVALAILDLHMPDVDGLALARRIREDPRWASLPLLLLSSSLVQAKEDPERLFAVRLLKPVRQSKLFDSILQVLGRAVVPAASTSVAAPSNGGSPAAPLRILVADDHPTNRDVARLVFRRFGYEVDLAVDGREAVERVGEREYDVVFMDVQMPELDGLEATRRIRRLRAGGPDERWPRIVAMTADAMPEDREICLASGMDDYLTKPLDFEAVRAALETVAVAVERRGPGTPPVRPPAAPTRPVESEAPRAGNGEVIDWSRLEELREYDTPDASIVRGTIATFAGQAAEKIEVLRTSALAGDAQALRAAAHGLKGAAMNIGAVVVAERAKQIEDAARQGSLDGVESMVEHLSAAVVATHAELDRRRWE